MKREWGKRIMKTKEKTLGFNDQLKLKVNTQKLKPQRHDMVE